MFYLNLVEIRVATMFKSVQFLSVAGVTKRGLTGSSERLMSTSK